jgi:predicted ATPase
MRLSVLLRIMSPPPPNRFSELSTLIKSGAGLHGGALSGQQKRVQGLYMFGGVGCGKTMLMDLLVASAPKEFQVSGSSMGL